MANRTLSTPISPPNINKVKIVEVHDRRDAETDPSFTIQVQFIGVGGRDAGTYSITARDTTNSQCVSKNAAPVGYGDIIIAGSMQVSGACTSLALAWDTAYDETVGTRTAKRKAGNNAALTEAQTIGLVSAELQSTNGS